MGDGDIGNVNWEDNINCYEEMVFDAAEPEFEMCSQPFSKVSNLNAQRFYSILEATKEPL